MCIGIETVIAIGAIGGALGYTASEAHKQKKHQEHIMERQAKAQKSLMEEYKEQNRPQASKLVSGLSTRDKQRMLARSMGGTLLTDPMGSGMPTYGKKTLLGE